MNQQKTTKQITETSFWEHSEKQTDILLVELAKRDNTYNEPLGKFGDEPKCNRGKNLIMENIMISTIKYL